ncbi:hypothetical protein SAMN06265795_104254 [Noviherbaspirillum humi]|uniref:Uncharacterized protein n=1 Tax=Noviherbaspirillum humi TaxID=1688639 RepID=A0A239G632_9BURK|nr:hypothetical protein [Noviherbaspirillum humi]SNS64228.1 hypothetical protein SAMN06265795_104254 [Noviherbaspirillum humi]
MQFMTLLDLADDWIFPTLILFFFIVCVRDAYQMTRISQDPHD